jgi:hypothetical protein
MSSRAVTVLHLGCAEMGFWVYSASAFCSHGACSSRATHAVQSAFLNLDAPAPLGGGKAHACSASAAVAVLIPK